MNSRLVPAIALVVVVVDGVLLATGAISPAVAFALFLAVEVPLGAIVVSGYVRRYRAHRTNTDSAGADTRRSVGDQLCCYLWIPAGQHRFEMTSGSAPWGNRA